jgi:hypothetical protein
MKRLFLALVVLAVAGRVFASKEGVLVFSSFHLESDGIGNSGKVVVDGQTDKNNRLSRLKVAAFGRDFVVSKEILKELKPVRPNGVRLSYEGGYKELGGRTIYLELQMAFTSHTVQRALLSLTEDGKIRFERKD